MSKYLAKSGEARVSQWPEDKQFLLGVWIRELPGIGKTADGRKDGWTDVQVGIGVEMVFRAIWKNL
jgi:hypothetical protein